ncbi:DDE transposase [Candidatus Regiella insecticola]|uniref:DDE transposase n=1 Tax=Candidatus Regiella insecticola TaxID=138073 RepID=UPI000681B60E|nr:DDE transposase [Candidatus Regiella insecticola]
MLRLFMRPVQLNLVGTSANVADVTQVHHLLHGQEEVVHGDAGYKGVMRRSEHQHRVVTWHIPRRRVLALPGQEHLYTVKKSSLISFFIT